MRSNAEEEVDERSDVDADADAMALDMLVVKGLLDMWMIRCAVTRTRCIRGYSFCAPKRSPNLRARLMVATSDPGTVLGYMLS